MKKFILLLAFATTLLSCSSDENNEIVANSASGNWKLTSIRIQNVEQSTPCEIQYGKFVLSAGSNATEFYGSYSGSTCIEESLNHTYTIVDNILTITESNATGVPYKAAYEIVEMTETNLKLKLFYVEQESPSGGLDIDNIPQSQQETYSYIKI